MRDEILRRFTAYLDGRLTDGVFSDELAQNVLTRLDEETVSPLESGDFYAVWAELTAVTQEVKLQSRSFKQIEEAMQGMTAELRRITEYTTRSAREREADIERRSRAETIDVILDVHDRLEHALVATQSVQPSSSRPAWLVRLVMGKAQDAALVAFSALREGYVLGLERLDDYLGKQQVRRLDCLGNIFDAHSMHVVALETTNSVPEGTVVEVYRNGYEWRGGIHRLAQVKVAKHESSSRQEKGIHHE